MLFVILVAWGCGIVQAATINVTANATDALNGSNGQCSLREAITNINNGATTYADCAPSGAYGSNDTINIPAGTYTTTIAGAGEDANGTGDYDILKDVTIKGADARVVTIDGNGGNIHDRVFQLIGSASVEFSGVTITNGEANDCGPNPGVFACGGAILNGSFANPSYYSGTLTVFNSTISNSRTVPSDARGGAIYGLTASGIVNIIDSTMDGNSSDFGGAISASGTIVILRSAIINNHANYYGGGIYSNADTVIANSTFTGNSAGTSGGAAINLGNPGSDLMQIINTTISGNSGGGAIDGYRGTTTITNSIVAAQTSGSNCTSGGNSGAIVSGGHNIDNSTSCGFTSTGDWQNTDPLLNPLADNGGPTKTMSLPSNSLALNAADNLVCVVFPINNIDQRGYSRPVNGVCDIGSYEYGAVPTVSSSRVAIPALSVWMLLLLAGMLGILGLSSSYRQS